MWACPEGPGRVPGGAYWGKGTVRIWLSGPLWCSWHVLCSLYRGAGPQDQVAHLLLISADVAVDFRRLPAGLRCWFVCCSFTSRVEHFCWRFHVLLAVPHLSFCQPFRISPFIFCVDLHLCFSELSAVEPALARCMDFEFFDCGFFPPLEHFLFFLVCTQ